MFDGDMPTHYLYAGTTSTWYSFNGSNFVIDKKSTIASPQSSYPYTTSLLNPYYTTLGDFDGDGREDVLTYGADMYNGVDKSNQLYLHDSYNTNFQANLLKSVTNGIGKTTQIAYQPLTYATTANNKPFYTKGSSSVYPVCDLQMPLYCVSNISEPNGQGGLLSTDFSYAEAQTQLTGVGFLGFKSQTTSNAAANKKSVTTTDLNSAYYLPDKITQDVSTLSNEAISKTEAYISNTQTGSIFESLKSKVVGTDYLTGLSNTTEYSGYDGYGNPTTVKTTQGNVVSTQTVAYVQKGSWCPNKPGSITVTKVKDGETYTRHVDYSYDDKGNLTGQTADAGDVNQKSVVYSQFNTFGQPTKAQITANGSTRAVSVTATPSGRFILSQTNVLGQTVSYSWDETRGLLNSQTDRLGTTTYTYNGLGQLLTTQYPTGIIKASTPQWATAGNAYNAKFYISTTVSGATPQNNWYDVLGREVLKETTGLNGKVARTFTEYNANGQLYRVSDPTFNSVADVWATTYAGYDAYGRPQTITSPMGTTTMAYSGTSTTVTSPNGTKQTVLNSAGQVQTNTVNGKTVTYNYFPSGLAKTATPDGGQAISMEYDLQGRRTKLTDPDAGIVESAYNGFGELLTEKQKVRNATDYIVTTNNYDGSTGLLQTVLRGAETTAYTYDTNKRISTIEIAGKNKQTFTYGDFDRVTRLSELINGTRSFDKQMEYDSYGRVSKEIFPSSYYTTNTYDTYGNLTEVKDVASRSIWKAVDANARGQLTKDSKGGKETTYGFDARGFNTSVQAVGVVDMAYIFDTKGNMYSRTDNRINQTEQFTYDPLNRLTNWDVHQTSSNSLLKANSITYDSNTGNITNKSDLGNFAMNYAEAKADGTNAGPHALTTIMGVATSFPAADLNVTYTDFKKMASLTEGTKNYTITYGVDQQRRKSEYSNNGTTSTRYYLGDYEEETDNLGNVKKIHYLSGGAMLINLNGVETLYYGYTDNQGSLVALTDASGNIVEKYAYDPWGARRNPNDWTQNDSRTSFINNRGYTGHEHLDAFGIINMNGRVYDPLTAQFFSPDPFVQAPDNWVNYNRYGYCMNNPLIYTDPTGNLMAWRSLKEGATYQQATSWECGGGMGGGGFDGMSGGGVGYSFTGSLKTDMYLEAQNRGYDGAYNDFQIAYDRQSRNSNFNGNFRFGIQYGYEGNYQTSREDYQTVGSNLGEVNIVTRMITVDARDVVKWNYLGTGDREMHISDQLNISTYWMGTISSLVPVALKSTGTAKVVTETLMVATKFASEKLFGVGVVMSFIDMRNNNYSTNSVLWAVADTGMGIIGFVPGGQLIAGLYFTGRIAYQAYDEINKQE